MAIDNTMFVVGNLTSVPELGYGSSGTPYCRFSVAQNERTRDENGNWKDGPTSYIRCVAFNSTAENFAQLPKGTRVFAIGRLRQNDWKPEATADDPDPKVRTSYELIIDSCGPELRWASVTVTKNDRRNGDAPPFDPDAKATVPSDVEADEKPF